MMQIKNYKISMMPALAVEEFFSGLKILNINWHHCSIRYSVKLYPPRQAYKLATPAFPGVERKNIIIHLGL